MLLKDPTLMGTFALSPPNNLVEVAMVGTYNMVSSIQKISDHNVSMDHREAPLEDYHHRSHLPDYKEDCSSDLHHPSVFDFLSNTVNTVDSEKNLSNIEETIAINILTKLDVVENIHVGKSCSPSELEIYYALFRKFRDFFAWSYEEIPGIDSSIVEHEIKMYPNVKPVRQRLRQVHPKKAAAIKEKVEKLLHAGFIYPVPLTDWVSNIVPVMKKQGMIRVCVNYRDVNQACPKENYPTPFIDQIIDECTGCEISSFMDGFSGHNQINIYPQDQSETTFICPWGTFAYRKLPFGLKNAGATFQREMNYAFHDINKIVQPYLDDLPAHLRKRTDHPQHMRAIFLRC
eukprot:PITA_12145